jgi:regulator of nonsense transcripts 2
MTKGYEKLLASCQTLSELLYIPVPPLPAYTQKSDSLTIGNNSMSMNGDGGEEINTSGGKWEDDEERKFFEDIPDLMDFVPRSVLGVDEKDKDKEESKDAHEEREKARLEQDKAEVKKLEEELQKLADEAPGTGPSSAETEKDQADEEDVE